MCIAHKDKHTLLTGQLDDELLPLGVTIVQRASGQLPGAVIRIARPVTDAVVIVIGTTIDARYLAVAFVIFAIVIARSSRSVNPARRRRLRTPGRIIPIRLRRR